MKNLTRGLATSQKWSNFGKCWKMIMVKVNFLILKSGTGIFFSLIENAESTMIVLGFIFFGRLWPNM